MSTEGSRWSKKPKSCQRTYYFVNNPKLLVAQFERKSMEKVNTGKTPKNEWTLLLIRMLEWHGFLNINSFPYLFISSSAFHCCGVTLQNILFHNLHLFKSKNISFIIQKSIKNTVGTYSFNPTYNYSFLTITLDMRGA